MDPHIETAYFPPVSQATPDGLLMLGGRLTPEWLLAAYQRGIFPWPIVDERRELLAWFSPDPRAILELDELHVSQRLRRRLRRGEFTITSDRDFAAVMAGCAAPRRDDHLTWITPSLTRAFLRMHELGYAHSIEVSQNGELVGGLYGVALGGFFAGESMFSRVRDASKAALVALVWHLQRQGFALFDVQQATPHLTRMGARLLRRSEFLERLGQARQLPVQFGTLDPQAFQATWESDLGTDQDPADPSDQPDEES